MCEKCMGNGNERFANGGKTFDAEKAALNPPKRDMAYQQEWLRQAKELAETDEYTRAILKTVMDIIDNKDYRYLYGVLLQYDKTMKKLLKNEGLPILDTGLPFWCCPIH